MDKKYAFILALAASILFYLFYSYYIGNEKNLREHAVISRIIDGDTLELADGRIVRLMNVNAPEKNKEIYKQAMNFLKLFENKTVEIETTDTDMYGRYLSRVYSPVYLNLELVKEGLASKFLVSLKELKEFSDAEKNAVENSLGVWKKSVYYGCFYSDIDWKNEKVFLGSKCGRISLERWTLKDESRKEYRFKNISFEEITIFSGKGKDSEKNVFWNLNGSVWNNDRDSLYLFDEHGNIAHYYVYGY